MRCTNISYKTINPNNKTLEIKPQDASPMDPREGGKRPLIKNKRDLENNKNRTYSEDRGSHHELAYWVHGYLKV